MSDPLSPITQALDRWFDDADRAALDEACRLASTTPVDLDALLAWLRDVPADKDPKDLATRRIRAALGLRPMPGPICRPVTFGPDGKVR